MTGTSRNIFFFTNIEPSAGIPPMALQYLFKLVLLKLIILGANGNLTKRNYYVLRLPKTKLLDKNPLKMVVQVIGFLWPMNLSKL